MAINIHCPHCNERLVQQKTSCTHCGEALPPGVLFALSAALGEPMPTMPMPTMPKVPEHIQLSPSPQVADQAHQPSPVSTAPTENSTLRPWLAAALSIVCGLGQLYNGQIAKGMILIVLATAAVASMGLLIGKLMIPVLWLYAIIDAYIVARRNLTPSSN